MIITDKKCIYIKIPKTGSTTVASEIWDRYGVNRTSPHEVVVNLNFVDHETLGAHGWHMKYARIEEHLGAEIAGYESFTVIRDPRKRIVSAFSWAAQKKPDHPLLQSLEGFLDAVDRGDPSLPKQARLHAEPQIGWLRDRAGLVPERMRIFSLDQLSELSDYFETRLGFTPDFGHKNASKKADAQLTQAAEAAITRLYAEDFDLYEKHG